MNSIKFISKKGSNRGASRVWLEGKRLESYGWVKGTEYTQINTTSAITLTKIGEQWPLDQRIKKVAGSVGRPVIDLVGKYIDNAGIGEHAQITITATTIVITGA